jgi:hypothetical protein
MPLLQKPFRSSWHPDFRTHGAKTRVIVIAQIEQQLDLRIVHVGERERSR